MALKIVGIVVVSVLVVAGGFAYWACGAFLPWREAGEAQRLIELAGVLPGQTVAEIGSGTGRFTVAIARHVGPSGRVYSTELDADNRVAVRERVESAGLGNVMVVEAAPLQTNLPDGCCDMVFMRNVYHHIGDPIAFARSVKQAVRAGGRLAVLDFEPGAMWFLGGRPDGASDRRPGHGVARADAIAEFTEAGFSVEREIANWSGPLWMVLFKRSG